LCSARLFALDVPNQVIELELENIYPKPMILKPKTTRTSNNYDRIAGTH